MRQLNVSGNGRTAIAALLVLVCNVYASWRLFSTEYLPHMHSIEAAYIALTRHVIRHFGDLSWYPFWESGEPFADTYQPGLPLLSGLLAIVFRLTPAHGYHAACALLYCLAPIGVFLLVKSMTGRRDAALVAGLAASLISPSAWLISTVRYDLGSVWYDRRYMVLVFYGEGPNVGGLSLVPWAWWGLHRVWTQWFGGRLGVAALASAAVVLVSWPAGVVMAMGVVCYVLAQSWPEIRERWWRVAVLGVMAYGLIATFVPISTIRVNQRNSQLIAGDYHYTKMHLLYWGVVLAGLALLRFGLQRVMVLVRFSAMLFWVLASVALGAFWWHIALMPQPERFHIGMEFPVFMMAGAVWLLLRNERVRIAGLALLLLFGLYQARKIRHFNKGLTGQIDITKTLEYQTARWLEEHRPGERTFAAGSVAFWMNAWSDVPQVTGCCLPGLPNPVEWIVGYVVPTDDGTKGHEAEISLLWLKAFGARTVVVGGERSRNAFRDWHTPLRYEGVLPKLWESGDDRIYEVPERTAGLWHVVPEKSLVNRQPYNGIDLEPLRPFVATLDDQTLPVAAMRWVNMHEMTGEAQFAAGQVLHVQETFVPGWHATVNGQERPVKADGLGLMVVEPGMTGAANIRLWWDGGTESLLLRTYSALAWLSAAGLLLLRYVRKSR